jgi:putative autoinducer-2 (AI-2) aldolase
LRYSAGTTVLTDLNDECILDIEDAIRVNASALAVMVAVGSKFEAKTIDNLVRTADLGNRYGIPTLGVTAVGKELVRDARYLSLAAGFVPRTAPPSSKLTIASRISRKLRPAARCPLW